MSKAGAEWSDQQILAATSQVDENGKRQFRMMLPDKSQMTSEWMDPNAIKARTLINWCEAVRGTIGAREEAVREEAAAKRARRKSGVPIADGITSSSPASPTTKPDIANDTEGRTSTTSSQQIQQQDGHLQAIEDQDAEAYAKRLLTIYEAKVADLKYQGQEILRKLKDAEAQYSKWKQIVETLGEGA